MLPAAEDSLEVGSPFPMQYFLAHRLFSCCRVCSAVEAFGIEQGAVRPIDHPSSGGWADRSLWSSRDAISENCRRLTCKLNERSIKLGKGLKSDLESDFADSLISGVEEVFRFLDADASNIFSEGDARHLLK